MLLRECRRATSERVTHLQRQQLCAALRLAVEVHFAIQAMTVGQKMRGGWLRKLSRVEGQAALGHGNAAALP